MAMCAWIQRNMAGVDAPSNRGGDGFNATWQEWKPMPSDTKPVT
jgi:hypothetical protein